MATLEGIRVHPIKSLDPVDRDRVRISGGGGLVGDREYAIRDLDGEYVNGKRTAAVHRLEADVDLDAGSVTVGRRGARERQAFHLERERDALAAWLSTYFGYDVEIERAAGGELTDSRVFGDTVPGATVVSTATLETVASWFPALDVEGARRRFRANLEVGGVEPFWEDRLVGDGGLQFRVGDVVFRGVKPVPRCVVPTRDPETGTATPGFRERFVEMREETFPDWADPNAFDHYFELTVLAHPEEDDRGATSEGDHRGGAIRVGDTVEVIAGTRLP